MIRPRWTRLYHFTHVGHLASILRDGLAADSTARRDGSLQHEAGDHGIKERRRRAEVPVGAGGVVADYVPFYFAPRSPMLFRIFKGGVTTYDGDQADLVYLCSTIERFDELGLPVVVTDRNAAVRFAAFSDDATVWGTAGFVDWGLMEAQYWTGTEDYPDRMERRMAECLVHDRVPWEAILAVGVIDDQHARTVGNILDDPVHSPKVVVRPEWYF